MLVLRLLGVHRAPLEKDSRLHACGMRAAFSNYIPRTRGPPKASQIQLQYASREEEQMFLVWCPPLPRPWSISQRLKRAAHGFAPTEFSDLSLSLWTCLRVHDCAAVCCFWEKQHQRCCHQHGNPSERKATVQSAGLLGDEADQGRPRKPAQVSN